MRIANILSIAGVVAGLYAPYQIGRELKKHEVIHDFLLNAQAGDFLSCYEDSPWITTQLFGNQKMSVGANGDIHIEYDIENRFVNVSSSGYFEQIEIPRLVPLYRQIHFSSGSINQQQNTHYEYGDSMYLDTIFIFSKGDNIYVSIPTNSLSLGIDEFNVCPGVDVW